MMENGTIVIVQQIRPMPKSSSAMITAREVIKTEENGKEYANYYTVPIDSSALGIYLVDVKNLKKDVIEISIDKLRAKMFILPFDSTLLSLQEKYVLIEMSDVGSLV